MVTYGSLTQVRLDARVDHSDESSNTRLAVASLRAFGKPYTLRLIA